MRYGRKITPRRMAGFTGQETCIRHTYERPGSDNCLGRQTRHYGEDLPEGGFTGWRGPFCSVLCYLAEYPPEEGEGT